MSKFYAVKSGRKIGIFNTWDECKTQIDQYPNAIYKSFSSIEDAKQYLNTDSNKPSSNNIIEAYVDGSYNVNTEEYSFGCALLLPDKLLKFKKKYEKDEYSQYRNVSGEVKGAMFVINYCINNDIKELNLYYDYEGINSWYNDLWKANNELTKVYKEFARTSKPKIKVNFVKVKSHSNNEYNDLADALAKNALGI
ncbi:MAG: viroplasmin family protein [Anaeroplasmataceae bacterium]